MHISYMVHRHLSSTKAGSRMSTTHHHDQGWQCLDIHLLKPAREWAEIATLGNQQVVGDNGSAQGPPGRWVN